MTVTVIGISGSPHRHGNTETLLDSFLDGAAHAGADTDKIILSCYEVHAVPGMQCLP